MAQPSIDQGWRLLNSVGYPWLVVSVMVCAYLATSVVDAGGPRTSFAIGMIGVLSLVLAFVYGWWVVLMHPEVGRRWWSSRDTRLWTGVTSTLVRWLRHCAGIVGWFLLCALTTLSLLPFLD